MKFYFLYILCCMASLGKSQNTLLICRQDQVGMFSLENVNTKSIEFSPTFYQSGIVFVEAREQNKFLDPKTGRAYFDLMYTDIGSDGVTSKVVSFSPNIRTQYHEGPCTFNHDGTEIYFTRSNLSGGTGINDEKGQVQLKIYHGVKGAEDWEAISELPFCSNEYSVAHPALSDDGKYLVFMSNMPGGYGGMDLYIVNNENGTWSTPVNLGPEINTKGNEAFPFWHASGVLIFSSNGHGGQGGLDLYATAWNGKDGFKGLQHLDAPFNSGKDDLGLIISADGKSGYLSSDRKPTKGKDDLYRWSSPESILCAPNLEPLTTKELLVRNEGLIPLDKSFVWLIPMNQDGPSLFKEHFKTEVLPNEDNSGTSYLKWGLTDTLSRASANASSNPDGRATFNTDRKSTYILVVQHDGFAPYVNVFSEDMIPKEVILKALPKKSTHCLNTRFLVYNETGDLILNGASIELSGSCLKEPLTIYTDGNGLARHCLPDNCPLKATIEQEGYATHTFTFTPNEDDELWSVYLKSGENLTAAPSPIASGTVIVLNNIYYDFNKSEIRKSDAGELSGLAKILNQYPDLKIELTSHTDTRGTAEYNMELSQRRSESSKAYLVSLGIDPSRIATKAAGESQPRNKCVDGVPCTEEEHQYNRRTEVRIINPAQGMEVKYKSQG
jgi:outer membrane protein OmpA-like peptidoglycan-associated protein/Tol biopolymer transport system component